MTVGRLHLVSLHFQPELDVLLRMSARCGFIQTTDKHIKVETAVEGVYGIGQN